MARPSKQYSNGYDAKSKMDTFIRAKDTKQKGSKKYRTGKKSNSYSK